MRLNDLANGRIDMPKLDPSIIKIRKNFNYRDMTSDTVKAHIDWLEQSIKDRGVQDPIEVEFVDDEVFLVDGECRLTAAQRLKKKGVDILIPVIQVRGDEGTVLARAIVANGGLPPTVLEFGVAAERLVGYGWDEAKIAALVPPSISGGDAKKALRFTQNALELQQAPLEVKELLKKGVDGVAVSPALAVAATRKGRLTAAENIKTEAAKAKATGKKEAKRPKGPGKAAAKKQLDADTTNDLLKLGDKMAAGYLSEKALDWETFEKLARRWNKARGIGE